MLINDLLDLLTVSRIVDKTVLINKHHSGLKRNTGETEFPNAGNIVDFPFFHPPTDQITGQP
jgi:hypothetical protein